MNFLCQLVHVKGIRQLAEGTICQRSGIADLRTLAARLSLPRDDQSIFRNRQQLYNETTLSVSKCDRSQAVPVASHQRTVAHSANLSIPFRHAPQSMTLCHKKYSLTIRLQECINTRNTFAYKNTKSNPRHLQLHTNKNTRTTALQYQV